MGNDRCGTRAILLLVLAGVLSCAGCFDAMPRQGIASVVAQVEKDQLETHVRVLAQAGPRSVQDRQATDHTVNYIKSFLLEHGYRPIEESIPYNEGTSGERRSLVNIVAEHRGSVEPSRILELGAHYDTVVASPGADDNASGIAAILEIARVLSGVKTGHTVRFCFFALEEHGRDGSKYHVNNIRQRGEVLDGAIILEMIGYATDEPDTQKTPVRIPLLFSPPTTGNFIAVVGNFRSGSLGNRFERAADQYVPALPYFSANRTGGLFKDAMRSDHKMYWDNGYRAIMLTDTANFRNPHYHQPSDTADTLNFEFLQRVTQTLVATLLNWDR